MTRETYNMIHRILLSALMTVIIWLIVKIFIVDIKFFDFFSIEILIVIGEFFSNFIKRRAGINRTSIPN